MSTRPMELAGLYLLFESGEVVFLTPDHEATDVNGNAWDLVELHARVLRRVGITGTMVLWDYDEVLDDGAAEEWKRQTVGETFNRAQRCLATCYGSELVYRYTDAPDEDALATAWAA